MIYTQKQLELMRLWQENKLKRINLLEGSVSSGKTWVSLVLWAFLVKTSPEDKQYLMCAKSLTTLKRNCLLLLQELVGERNFTFSLSSKEGRLFGRKIFFEGANDSRSEAKIRGMTLQAAYCDELTQFPEDFYTMLLSRLRLPNAKIIATTNPDNPLHWLKVNYIDREDELDLLDVKFLLEDNDKLPPDYIENIKKEYTGVFYDRFILGNWVAAEGLIYPMYEMALEEPPKATDRDRASGRVAPDGVYKLAEKYTLSIDYGTMNAFSCLLWGKYGSVWYAVDSYYYSGRDNQHTMTDDEYADKVDDLFGSVYGSTYNRIEAIIDPSAASFIAALQRRKLYRVVPADNAVSDGIRETGSAIQQGYIKINPSITEWISEAGGYVWADSDGDDVPVKVNDHAMDATRYFVHTKHIVRKGERGIL
jgi:PBSX family phage terminase large subunit